MTIHFKLERLIADCEMVSDALELLNPNHDLLRFDGKNCADVELDQKLDLLMREFGPSEYNSHIPSDAEMVFAFSSLLQALNTALVIEKAKSGHYRPK